MVAPGGLARLVSLQWIPTKRRHGYRKVCRRVNAGRSDRIAFHQSIHSDIGLARSVVTNDAVTRELTMPALNLA